MNFAQYLRRECTIDGHVVRLWRACAEILSTLLLADPGQFIRVGELIEATWPDVDQEPEWAMSMIRKNIHRLRALGVLIETSYVFGYRVHVGARG